MSGQQLTNTIKRIVSLHRTSPVELTTPELWSDLHQALVTAILNEIHFEPTQIFSILYDTLELTLKSPNPVLHQQTLAAIIDTLQVLFSSQYESSFSPSPTQIFEHLTLIYSLFIDNFQSFFTFMTTSYIYLDYLQFFWDAWRIKEDQWSNTNTKPLYETFLSKVVKQHAHLFTLLGSFVQYQSQPYHLTNSRPNHITSIRSTGFIDALQHEQSIYNLSLDSGMNTYQSSNSSTTSSALSTIRSSLHLAVINGMDQTQQNAYNSLYQRTYTHIISPQHTTNTINPYLMNYMGVLATIAPAISTTTNNMADEDTTNSVNNDLNSDFVITPSSFRLLISAISFLHTSFSMVMLHYIITGDITDFLVQELTVFFSNVILSSLDQSLKLPPVPVVKPEIGPTLFKFAQQSARFCTPDVFGQLCPLMYVDMLPVLDTTLDLLAVPPQYRQRVVDNGADAYLHRIGLAERDTGGNKTKNEKEKAQPKSLTSTHQNSSPEPQHSYLQYCLNASKRSSAFDLIQIFLSSCYGTVNSNNNKSNNNSTNNKQNDSPQYDYQTLTDHLMLYTKTVSATPEFALGSGDNMTSKIPNRTTTINPTKNTQTSTPKPSTSLPIELSYQFIPFWFDIILMAIRHYYQQRSNTLTMLVAQRASSSTSSFSDSDAQTAIHSITQQITRNTNQHQWMVESTLTIILMKMFTSQAPIQNVTQSTQSGLHRLYSKGLHGVVDVDQNHHFNQQGQKNHDTSSMTDTITVISSGSGNTLTEWYNLMELPILSILSAQMVNFQHFFSFYMIGSAVFTPSKDKSLAFFTLLQSTIIHLAYSLNKIPPAGVSNQKGKALISDNRFITHSISTTTPSGGLAELNSYYTTESNINGDNNEKTNGQNLHNTFTHVLAAICVDEHDAESTLGIDTNDQSPLTLTRVTAWKEQLYTQSLSRSNNFTPKSQILPQTKQKPFQHPIINYSNNSNNDAAEETNRSLWAQVYNSITTVYYNPYYQTAMVPSQGQNEKGHKNFENRSEESNNFNNAQKYVDTSTPRERLYHISTISHKYTPSGSYINPFTPSWSLLSDVLTADVQNIDELSDSSTDNSLYQTNTRGSGCNITVMMNSTEMVQFYQQRSLLINLVSSIVPTIFMSILALSADIATNTLSLYILIPSYLQQLSLIYGFEVKKMIEFCHNFQPNHHQKSSKDCIQSTTTTPTFNNPSSTTLDHFSAVLSRTYCQFRQPQTLFQHYFAISSLLLIPQSIRIVTTSPNFSQLSSQLIPIHPINTFSLSLPTGDNFPDALALTTAILSQCNSALVTLAGYQQLQLFGGLKQIVESTTDHNNNKDKKSKNLSSQINTNFEPFWNSPNFSELTNLPHDFPLLPGSNTPLQLQFASGSTKKQLLSADNNTTLSSFNQFNLSTLPHQTLMTILTRLAPHFDHYAFPHCELLRTITTTLTQLAQFCTITHLDNQAFLTLLENHKSILYKATVIENLRTHLVKTVWNAMVKVGANGEGKGKSGAEKKSDKNDKKSAKKRSHSEMETDTISTTSPQQSQYQILLAQLNISDIDTTVLIHSDPYASLLLGAINDPQINPSFHHLFTQYKQQSSVSTITSHHHNTNYIKSLPTPVVFTAPALMSLCSAIYNFKLRAEEPTQIPRHTVFPQNILSAIIPPPLFPLTDINIELNNQNNLSQSSIWKKYFISLSRTHFDLNLPLFLSKIITTITTETLSTTSTTNNNNLISINSITALGTITSLLTMRLSTPSYCEVQSRQFTRYFVEKSLSHPPSSMNSPDSTIKIQQQITSAISNVSQQDDALNDYLGNNHFKIIHKMVQNDRNCVQNEDNIDLDEHLAYKSIPYRCGHISLAQTYISQLHKLIALTQNLKNEQQHNHQNSLNQGLIYQLTSIIGHLLAIATPFLNSFYQTATSCPCFSISQEESIQLGRQSSPQNDLQNTLNSLKQLITSLVLNENNVFTVINGDNGHGIEGNANLAALHPSIHTFLTASLPSFEWLSSILPDITVSLVGNSIQAQLRTNFETKNVELMKQIQANDDEEKIEKPAKKSKKSKTTDSQIPLVQLSQINTNNQSLQQSYSTLVIGGNEIEIIGTFFEQLSAFTMALSNPSQQSQHQNRNQTDSQQSTVKLFIQLISTHNIVKTKLNQVLALGLTSTSSPLQLQQNVNNILENTIEFLQSLQPFVFLHLFRSKTGFMPVYLIYGMYMLIDIYTICVDITSDRLEGEMKTNMRKIKMNKMSTNLNHFVTNFVTNPLPPRASTSDKATPVFISFAENFYNLLQCISKEQPKQSQKDQEAVTEKKKSSKKSKKSDSTDTDQANSHIPTLPSDQCVHYLISHAPTEVFAQLIQVILPATTIADVTNIITTSPTAATTPESLLPSIIIGLLKDNTPKSAHLLLILTQTLTDIVSTSTNSNNNDNRSTQPSPFSTILPQLVDALCNLVDKSHSELKSMLSLPTTPIITDLIEIYTYHTKSIITIYNHFSSLQTALGNQSLTQNNLQTKMSKILNATLSFELVSYCIYHRDYTHLTSQIDILQELSCMYKVDTKVLGKKDEIPTNLIGSPSYTLLIKPLLDQIPSASAIPTDSMSYLPIPIRFVCFLLYLHHVILQTTVVESPITTLDYIESSIISTIQHAIITPQPILIPGNNGGEIIAVVGSSVVTQMVIQLSNSLFLHSNTPTNLFTNLISLARFTPAVPSPNSCNVYSTTMFVSYTPSSCIDYCSKSLLTTFISYAASVIVKAVYHTAGIPRNVSSKTFTTLFTVVDLMAGINGQGPKLAQTDDKKKIAAMADDDGDQVAHIMKLNAKNLTSNTTIPKMELNISKNNKLYTPYFNALLEDFGGDKEDQKIIGILKQNSLVYIAQISNHLSLLLALVPSTSITLSTSCVENNTIQTKKILYSIQYSLKSLFESLIYITKPIHTSATTTPLPFKVLTAIFNTLALLNPLLTQPYTQLPPLTFNNKAMATSSSSSISSSTSSNETQNQTITTLPYTHTPTTIALDTILSIFPLYATILVNLPTHITSLGNNNNNPNQLESLSQSLSALYASSLVAPTLNFTFSISNFLHNTMSDYIEQLTRLYTANHHIIAQTNKYYNIHLDNLSTAIHYITKVLINTTYQNNKKMVPYLLFPLYNIYLVQYSHYSSQTIISLMQSISFALSIMLATVQVPKSSGSLVVVKQRETEVLTDVDMVVTDLTVLNQYLDAVGKTGLAQMIGVAQQFRYYR